MSSGDNAEASAMRDLASHGDINDTGRLKLFSRMVLTTFSWAALFVAVALLLLYGAQIFLLAFAGILLGIGLGGMADWLSAKARIKRGYALAVVTVTLVAFLAALLATFGWRIAGQADEMAAQIPRAITALRKQAQQTPVLRRFMDPEATTPQMLSGAAQEMSQQTRSNLLNTAKNAFYQFGVAFGGIVLVFFLGMFFAGDPETYKMGVLHLLPCGRRARAREVLETIGFTLRRWWIGALLAMASAGAATFICLWLLGIPLALSLAGLAAIGEVIPNFGPIFAAIPAVLVAFLAGPTKALAVVGVYLVVQTLQSYIVQPLVQKRAVDLPPAVQIVSQVLMATLFGPLGLLLATPLLAAILVIVRMLYIQDIIDEQISAKPGGDPEKEKAPEAAPA